MWIEYTVLTQIEYVAFRPAGRPAGRNKSGLLDGNEWGPGPAITCTVWDEVVGRSKSLEFVARVYSIEVNTAEGIPGRPPLLLTALDCLLGSLQGRAGPANTWTV